MITDQIRHNLTAGIDDATGLPSGITDLRIYHLAKDRELKEQKDYTNLPITEKHSCRWIQSIEDSVAKMPKVKSFTQVEF